MGAGLLLDLHLALALALAAAAELQLASGSASASALAVAVWRSVSVAPAGIKTERSATNVPAWIGANKRLGASGDITREEVHARARIRVVMRDVEDACRTTDVHADPGIEREEATRVIHRKHQAGVRTGSPVKSADGQQAVLVIVPGVEGGLARTRDVIGVSAGNDVEGCVTCLRV